MLKILKLFPNLEIFRHSGWSSDWALGYSNSWDEGNESYRLTKLTKLNVDDAPKPLFDLVLSTIPTGNTLDQITVVAGRKYRDTPDPGSYRSLVYGVLASSALQPVELEVQLIPPGGYIALNGKELSLQIHCADLPFWDVLLDLWKEAEGLPTGFQAIPTKVQMGTATFPERDYASWVDALTSIPTLSNCHSKCSYEATASLIIDVLVKQPNLLPQLHTINMDKLLQDKNEVVPHKLIRDLMRKRPHMRVISYHGLPASTESPYLSFTMDEDGKTLLASYYLTKRGWRVPLRVYSVYVQRRLLRRVYDH